MAQPEPHYRRDPVTGHWILVAGARAARPGADIASTGGFADALNAHAAASPFAAPSEPRSSCPFCPGSEADTPPAVYTVAAVDDDPPLLGPDGPRRPEWAIRVVPNLYPAAICLEQPVVRKANAPPKRPRVPLVQPPVGLPSAPATLEWQAPGHGRHEVVIECPHHCWTTSAYSGRHHTRIFQAYQQRLLAMKEEGTCPYAVVFKNVGTLAGASQPHSHSQILATAMTPPHVQQELREAAHYCTATGGRNVFVDMMHSERLNGSRLVAETGGLLAWCPVASRFPGELWVAPKERQSRFEDTPDSLLGELGNLWPTLLIALENMTPTKCYNYYLHTAPLDDKHWAAYHWHLEIVPRTVALGGFELASGSFINPLPPELAAERWRHALS